MARARIAVLWRPGRNIELQQRFLGTSLRDDSLDEARYIAGALREGGFETGLIKWEPGRPDLVFEEIVRLKPHLVFNVSSEEEVSFCESAGIPFAGSGIDLVPLDKAVRKKIWLYHRIPTPPFVTVSSSRCLDGIEEMLRGQGLTYPLFVKPAKGRGSSGITESSIVREERTLREACLRIIKTLRQPALVERYVSGREISVGLVGNAGDLLVLPLLEVGYSGARTNTFRHKMNDREILECPAKLKETLKAHIEDTARRAFAVLGARDYARIDLMVEHGSERIYLLELNTFPGLTLPPRASGQQPGKERKAGATAVHTSYMGRMAEALARTGTWLVCYVVEAALKRHRIWRRSYHVA